MNLYNYYYIMPYIKLCIRCGSPDHTNKECKNPVTSFGLVVYKNSKYGSPKGRMYPFIKVPCTMHNDHPVANNIVVDSTDNSNNSLLFFLVERKDTVGFLNLVQGSYSETEPYKSKKILKYLSELTCEERIKLQEMPFIDLWNIAGTKKRDYSKAEKKFTNLNISELLNKYPIHYQECDYIMPKGRLKYNETILDCALREFAEESGYSQSDVKIKNIPPYEETFVGMDGKLYKNVFFVAELKNNAHLKVRLGEDPNQSKEVRNMGWFSLPDCKKLLRDYHVKKLEILTSIYSAIIVSKYISIRSTHTPEHKSFIPAVTRSQYSYQ